MQLKMMFSYLDANVKQQQTIYLPILLPSMFSICIGLSLLLSTPLLGVGEGQRGDGGSLSTITMLSKDLARLFGNIFRPVVDDEVVPFDNSRAISCSIDRGSTARVEICLHLIHK